jgi:hypothetical protein
MSVLNTLTIQNLYGVTTNKGDIMVNDGSKNNRIPVGSDSYVLSADSSQSTGLRWIDPKTNNLTYSQVTLTALPIASTSTIPISIPQFQLTPSAGTYIIFYNIVYALSNVYTHNVKIGIYKNGTIVSGSEKTLISGANDSQNCYSTNFQTSFNGTDILTICVYVNAVDTSVTITDGSLFVLQVSDV